MTKLDAWILWCEKAHSRTGNDKFTLEMSSHGKAFSCAWDAAIESIPPNPYWCTKCMAEPVIKDD